MSFPMLSETPLEEVTNCVEEKGIPMDGFLAKWGNVLSSLYLRVIVYFKGSCKYELNVNLVPTRCQHASGDLMVNEINSLIV